MKRNSLIYLFIGLQLAFTACGNTIETAQEKVNESVKIMTFNVQRSDLYGWNDPTWEYDTSRGEKVVQAIIKAGADIVGLQEYSHNSSDSNLDVLWLKKKLDEKTGEKWHYSTAGTGVLSRYPIEKMTDSEKGVVISIEDQKIYVFSTHIGLQPDWNHYYIPYSAAIKNEGVYLYSQEEIVRRARLNWDTSNSTESGLKAFTEPMKLVQEVEQLISEGNTVVLMGDFNETSHYDWTQKTVDAGIAPRAIEAPFSKLLTEDMGMKDSFHEDRINKSEDEVSRRGFTWTPFADVKNWKKDDDRIDFIYYWSESFEVINSQVVGEQGGEAVDIEISGKFPSDHRAVVSSFSIN